MFDWYASWEYPLAATQLVLAMLGMGATLSIADFKGVFQRPLAISFGILTQLVIVPLLCWGLASATGMTDGIMVGLVLIAAMPGGAMSNIFTFLGRGNAALSISMTAVSTLLCLATTPVILRVFAAPYLPATFEMPVAKIVLEIGWSLLLPLAAGMVFGHYAPGIKDRFTKVCIRLSLAVLTVIVVGSLGSGRIVISAYGLWVPVVIVSFCVAAQLISIFLGWLLKLPDPDNLAVGIEVTVRNSNLALLLKASLFPIVAGGDNTLSDAVLFMVLYYGGTSLSVVLLPLLRHRWGRSPLPLLSARPANNP